MKVYRIQNDGNHYQYFLIEQEADVGALRTACTPLADHWLPPPVYIYEPKHKVGDFYNFSSDHLITAPRATEALRTHLEKAGELLPLPFEGQEFTLLNVLQCVDCLAPESKKVRSWMLGNRAPYLFDPDKLAQVPSTIFKIPETCRAEVLVVEGLHSPADEFRHAVEAAGLKGLLFKEIWSDES